MDKMARGSRRRGGELRELGLRGYSGGVSSFEGWKLSISAR